LAIAIACPFASEANFAPGFLLAIADFHKPVKDGEIGSMTYTQSALWQYLYGQRIYWEYEGENSPMIS
jgi:hypothetical protein